MKVLHVIDCMRIGGAQRRLFQLLKGLEERPEFENHLVLFSDDSEYPGLEEIKVKIHILNTPKLLSYHSYKEFKKIVADVNPDIVHSWQLIVSFYSAVLSKFYTFRHLNAMINDSTPRSFFNKERLLAKLTIPLSHVIISNSKAGLKAYQVKSNSNAHVIYNGFDFSRIEKIKPICKKELFDSIDDETLVIGMVARFDAIKDYKTIIQAVIELLDIGYKLKFIGVGGGETLASCQAQIPDRYAKDILLLGKRSDVDSIVNLIDIGVLSTFSEGISNAIMEYMAFKKVVVASDCPGNRELVAVNETGFLPRIADVNDWKEKLLEIINNKELLSKMGENGYERLHQYFNLTRMIVDYSNLYNKEFVNYSLQINKVA